MPKNIVVSKLSLYREYFILKFENPSPKKSHFTIAGKNRYIENLRYFCHAAHVDEADA